MAKESKGVNTKEYDELNIHYRPPDTTSSEYYSTEINNFQAIFNNVSKEIYNKESYDNNMLSILSGLIVIFKINKKNGSLCCDLDIYMVKNFSFSWIDRLIRQF